MAQYDGSLKFDTSIDEKGFEKGTSKIGSIAQTALGVLGGNLMTQAINGIGNLGKAAVESVASLEQNIGGIETLFKDSAQTVIENAENAYKTAGMSANEYMQNVTSFSASLLQSVGGDTAEAARVADMAMVDMADNANKMGTSMESIQNAYQGFAKQNYTMLDNLKLGYGGTKEEMERLLADAEKLSGTEYDISNLNDVYEAIHVIQGELGITGTTALEAASTIEGSMASAKAAFDNFLNGTGSAEELATTFAIAATNIGSALMEIVPRLIETIPVVIQGIGTAITENSDQLVAAGMQLLQGIITGIMQAIPILASVGLSIISSIANGIISSVGQMNTTGQSSIQEFISGIMQKLPDVIVSGGQILTNLVNKILSGLPQFLQSGIQLIGQMAQGLLSNLPAVLGAIGSILGQLLTTIASHLPQLLQAGIELIGQMVSGIISSIPQIVTAAGQLVSDFLGKVKETDWIQLGKDIINGVANGIKNAASNVIQAIGGVIDDALDWAKNLLGIHSPSRVFANVIGKNIPLGTAKGIDETAYRVSDSTRKMVDDAVREARIGVEETGNGYMPAYAYGNDGRSPENGIDYDRIGEKMAEALDGVDVSMDGQKVGSIVSEPVNNNLGSRSRMEERDMV